MTALVVVAAGVPAGLWLLGQRATGQMTVVTGVPACTGVEPTVRAVDEDFRRLAIPMARGFTCTVGVQVSNTGSAEVDLDRVVVPVSGPRGGAGMRVTRIGGLEVAEDGEVDAVVVLDQSVRAGEEVLVEVDLQFRPNGCSPRGGTLWIQPTLVVGHLLATRQLRVADFPLLLGTADSSCDT